MSVTTVMVRQYGIQFRNHKPVQRTIDSVPGGRLIPMTFNEAMFSASGGTQGAIVKGIEPEAAAAVLGVDECMESGRFEI